MKKSVLALAIFAILACLFAFSVCAEDKIVVHSDDSLSNEVSRLDALENPNCTDTESRIVLTDLNGNYYVFPAYYFVKNQSNYTIDSTNLNAAITAYNDANGTEYFTGFDHTGGTGSFRGKCLNLVRLELPTYVTTFNGSHKFEGCANLKEVIFPYYYSEEEGRNVGYVTSNGSGAQNWFTGCSSLVSVTNFGNLPLTTLQNACFSGCSSLKEIELPYKLTSVVGDGFNGCSALEKVVFPSTLKSVGGKVFKSCKALKTLKNFENTQITSITEEMFAYTTSLQTVTFPSTVTAIKKNAFNSSTALTSIEIGPQITEIGYAAFLGSGLTTVTVPETVTTIGQNVFESCASLVSATVKSQIVSAKMFNGCSNLTSVTLENTVTIYDRAFRECDKLESIKIPEGTESIYSCAFWSCDGLTNVYVPSTVTYMEDKVFESTGVKTAVVKSTVVGERMFYSTPLSEITLENTVSIGKNAFDKCDFTSIVLPETVTTIEDSAFASCKELTSITIPSGVETVSANAFSYCTVLETVNYTGNNEELLAGVTMPNENVQIVEQNHCITYYGGEHNVGEELTVSDSNYFERIVVTNNCVRCGISSITVEEIEPLFEWVGYSYCEYAISMAQCFKVNEDAIVKYEKYAPDFTYGIVAAVNTTDGAINALDNEKVISKEMGKLKYNYVDVKVTGIGEENANTKIVFCLYVKINEDTYYLDNETTNNSIVGISYNGILNSNEGEVTE